MLELEEIDFESPIIFNDILIRQKKKDVLIASKKSIQEFILPTEKKHANPV